MIERIYSNAAVFHDSERIITTYKFEDTEHSQLVKSHVAKALSLRRQIQKQVASQGKSQEKSKTQTLDHAIGELPSPPVDTPMIDETAVSPIALDTPSSLKDEEDMSITEHASPKESIKEEMTEADILEKLAQLKAEKHQLFQQVKNMMVSKETPGAEPVIMVPKDSKPSDVGPAFDIQYSTPQLAVSRPSSPPTSPHNRISTYPSPSSPSEHGPVSNFKNAFKFSDRPFSRTPYVRLKKNSIEMENTHRFLTRAHLLTQERRPYSPNTPPLSPPTAGRRPPVTFGQPYRHGAPRQGYFNRGMPPRRY
jgi:hypothetical protein